MASFLINIISSLNSSSVPYIIPIFLAIIVYLSTKHLTDPLSRIPGPFLARYTRLWLVHHARKGNMHQTMISLHNQHGNLVRTGPNEVSTSDPAAIKLIYGSGNKFRKGDWYSVWQGHRQFDLFGERDESIHRAQRRLVSRIYSMDGLKEMEPYVDAAVTFFLYQLGKRAGQTIDMGRWVQLFAFDVIGEVTFSKRFGYMDAAQDDGAFSQINASLKSGAWIGQIPWLYWMHDRLSPVIGNWLGITTRHGSIQKFASQAIEKRMLEGSDHRDILEKLIEVHKEKPEEFNANAVLSMATTNVFAGSDTTAISIGAVLFYLCANSGCKKKLMDEIMERYHQGKIKDSISLKDAMQMPYLQACMYEALRLHPAVGMSLPRVVPQEGIHIDDTYIPGGTVIGTNPWVIHRNTEIFGSDTDTFRPERWLEGNRAQMDRSFLAFGGGARLCIGKNLSWVEMSKVIPLLFLNFEIELVEPGSVRQECWWFVKQQGLFIQIRRR